MEPHGNEWVILSFLLIIYVIGPDFVHLNYSWWTDLTAHLRESFLKRKQSSI